MRTSVRVGGPPPRKITPNPNSIRSGNRNVQNIAPRSRTYSRHSLRNCLQRSSSGLGGFITVLQSIPQAAPGQLQENVLQRGAAHVHLAVLEALALDRGQDARQQGLGVPRGDLPDVAARLDALSLIHISEPTRLGMISYAVFCLK